MLNRRKFETLAMIVAFSQLQVFCFFGTNLGSGA